MITVADGLAWAPTVAFAIAIAWQAARPRRVLREAVGARWLQNLGLMLGNRAVLGSLPYLTELVLGSRSSLADSVITSKSPVAAAFTIAAAFLLLDLGGYAVHR